MKLNSYKDLIGALAACGSGAYLVETEEEAQELMELIDGATVERELEGEEFEAAKHILNLDGYEVNCIYSLVNGSEFFVCLSDDWDDWGN